MKQLEETHGSRETVRLRLHEISKVCYNGETELSNLLKLNVLSIYHDLHITMFLTTCSGAIRSHRPNPLTNVCVRPYVDLDLNYRVLDAGRICVTVFVITTNLQLAKIYKRMIVRNKAGGNVVCLNYN